MGRVVFFGVTVTTNDSYFVFNGGAHPPTEIESSLAVENYIHRHDL